MRIGSLLPGRLGVLSFLGAALVFSACSAANGERDVGSGGAFDISGTSTTGVIFVPPGTGAPSSSSGLFSPGGGGGAAGVPGTPDPAPDGPFSCDVGNPPVTAETPPPALSGGTLLAFGNLAAVADPNRDAVYIVDLGAFLVTQTIALSPGDEPGRLVADAAGHVHVALRRGGAVATIDPATGAILARTPVCPEPRGLAYDPATDLLHVACEDGNLISFGATRWQLARSVFVDRDLRDVILDEGRLVVSRFHTAEVLLLNADGSIFQRRTLPLFTQPPANGVLQSFEPSVAWRMAEVPGGGIALVHQRAFQGRLDIDFPQKPQQPCGGVGGSGGGPGGPGGAQGRGGGAGVSSGSGYSSVGPGGPTCPTSAVHSTVSILRPGPNGAGTGPDERAPSPAIDQAALPIDVAVSSTGQVAIATAGVSKGGVLVAPLENIEGGVGPFDCMGVTPISFPETAVAVAFLPSGTLLVQTLEPARLYVGDFPIDLPGRSALDTAQTLFHTAPDGSLACASCHPEGREDGRVWLFNQDGKRMSRRTQLLSLGGLLATAPFHWDGAFADMSEVLDEVFTRRMGGGSVCPDNATALAGWLDQLPPPAPHATVQPGNAAARGQALFFDPTLLCSTCHSGPRFTDDRTVDVGTGDDEPAYQVPSLIGVGSRPPYLHNGCAATLQERFTNPCAGGDKHGHTSGLTSAQIDDLVAFLETL
jgi:hypothetical protein